MRRANRGLPVERGFVVRLSLSVVIASLATAHSRADLPALVDLAEGTEDAAVVGADPGDLLSGDLWVGYGGAGPLVTGDFNGDRIADLLIGAPKADGPANSRQDAGEAYVVLGRADLAGTLDLGLLQPDLVVLGGAAGDHLGTAVAAGDVNGDGFDDVIVGARLWDGPSGARPDAGAVHVVFGSADLSGTVDVALGQADFTMRGADAGDQLGWAVATGDVDGDGIHDVLAGAPGADGPGNSRVQSGEAYVVFGSTTLSGTLDLLFAAPGVKVYGAAYSGFAGRELTSGDLDGDGIDELIVGIYQDDLLQPLRAAVFAGSTAHSPAYDLETQPPAMQVLGVRNGSLASGDCDGDGRDDLIVGAALDNEVHVILGSTPLPAAVDLGSGMGDLVVHAGDIGDELGTAVASGDLNGDGIEDVLIGAPYAGGPSNTRGVAGEAYAVLGASGLGGSVLVFAGEQDVTVLGAYGESDCDPLEGLCSVSGDELGSAVAAGDVNGDGFDDLVAGAPWQGAGGVDHGKVYVVLGGPFDRDGDGLTDELDCQSEDSQVWQVPGEVGPVVLVRNPHSGLTALGWTPPGEPGGVSLVYDTLRSDVAADFVDAASCLESGDGSDLIAIDDVIPAPGTVSFYLVRARNSCGAGSLGQSSDGQLRAGRECP